MQTIALTREMLIDFSRNRLDIDSAVDIQVAFENLSQQSVNRAVMTLMYVWGFNTIEIAQIFGIPITNTREEIFAGLLFIGEFVGLRDTRLYRHFKTNDKLWQARKARMITFFREYSENLDVSLEQVTQDA